MFWGAKSELLETISLFSGAGGLDLGFECAGFNLRVAVEKEIWACKTLRRNFPNTVVLGPPTCPGDVRKMTGSEIMKAGDLGRDKVQIVIGGPPCQPFSIAAAQRFLKGDNRYKRIGFEDRKRGNLTFEFFRLVFEIRPKMFLIENVPGLADLDNGKTISGLRQAFNEIGYRTSEPFIVNAADYGVPQRRERLFLIGSLLHSGEFTFPEPGHWPMANLKNQPLHRTVAHALYGLAPDAPNHITRNHQRESILRYRKLGFGERDHLGRVDRLDPRKPSKTVIAGGSKGGGRSHLHPYVARTLTVRECARIQSFPDDFVFEGTTGRQFTQVGNAVPPLLAEAIARHIRICYLGFAIKAESKLSHMYDDSLSLSKMCESLLQAAVREAPDLTYYLMDKSIQTTAPAVKSKKGKVMPHGRVHETETLQDNGLHTLERFQT